MNTGTGSIYGWIAFGVLAVLTLAPIVRRQLQALFPAPKPFANGTRFEFLRLCEFKGFHYRTGDVLEKENEVWIRQRQSQIDAGPQGQRWTDLTDAHVRRLAKKVGLLHQLASRVRYADRPDQILVGTSSPAFMDPEQMLLEQRTMMVMSEMSARRPDLDWGTYRTASPSDAYVPGHVEAPPEAPKPIGTQAARTLAERRKKKAEEAAAEPPKSRIDIICENIDDKG